MSEGERTRAYKLPTKTCRQIDYLNLILNKEKTKVISEAVNFSFILYTYFSEDVRNGLIQLASNKNDEELLLMIKETLFNRVVECDHP